MSPDSVVAHLRCGTEGAAFFLTLWSSVDRFADQQATESVGA